MKPKNVLAAAALTAGSIGFACSGSSPEAKPIAAAEVRNTSTTAETKSQKPSPSGEKIGDIPLDEIHGLARGDKIETINVYTPKMGEEKEYILKSSGKYYAEDLGVVYSEDFARLFSKSGEVPKEIPCFLFSSFGGKIASSGVMVDRDTHEILDFTGMSEVEKSGPVISYRDTNTGQGFAVCLELLGEGSAKLIFDGVSPYEFEQEIKDSQEDRLTTA